MTAAALTAAFVIFSIVSQISLRHQIKKDSAVLEQFISQTRDDLGFINESQELMKQNAQQVRQYMSLPSLLFPTREDEAGKEDEIPSVSTFELAAYDAASYLDQYNREFQQIRWFNDFLTGEEFTRLLEDLSLTLRKDSDFKRTLLDRSRHLFFEIRYDTGDDKLQLKSLLYGTESDYAPDDPASLDLIRKDTVRQERAFNTVEQLNDQLLALTWNREFKTLLKEKDIYFGPTSYRKENLVLPLQRKDNSVLTSLTTDTVKGVFLFNNKDYNVLDLLIAGVRDYLNTSDLRTDAEILDGLVLDEMVQLMKDQAFTAHLEKLGYSVSMDAREDNDYIYYDLQNSKGESAGAFALQKEFGEVYLMDRDDIPVRSLRTFSSGHELTYAFQEEEASSDGATPFIPAQGSETFLLIGSHEHNADTMIIAHFNSVTEDVVMISVPRDLYYKGMKINSIYRNYGPDRLAAELSTITGLRINKYIAIDMYAFIDVVNLLGGITVNLEEPLIDPTYKVRENARWSTLYYPAGEHHLDGVAALRVARSRHTSSDFGRAVRQQQVIGGIRNSLSGMGLSDLSRAYDFMQIARKYLSTNLSTSELVKYFLSYRDYKINGQNVLNTDNVLYATYTNLYRLTDEEQRKALEDPGFYKGGWIVLPKNNDWNRIKQFIQSIMMSS